MTHTDRYGSREMTRQTQDQPTSTRHRTDIVSLIFGLLFLGVAGWWAASYYLDWMVSWQVADAGWLLAGGLILLGLIGIVASLRRRRSNGEPSPAASTDATEPVTPAAPSGPMLSTPVVPADPQPDVAPSPPGPEAGAVAAGSDPELVRPEESIADPDRPAASDPGGHRPA